MTFQKHLEEKANVGDICRWIQNLLRGRTGLKNGEMGLDVYNSNKDSQEIVDICQKFYRTWANIGEKIFETIQPQHYPSSKHFGVFQKIII